MTQKQFSGDLERLISDLRNQRELMQGHEHDRTAARGRIADLLREIDQLRERMDATGRFQELGKNDHR